MPNDFYGLPLHPLVVHATAVIIPLAVLAVILSVAWPRFRAWAGPLPAGLSLIGLILVPLSTSTGETLEKHVADSALLDKHTQLAEGLLPWMIALFVFAAVGYYVHWRTTNGQSSTKAIRIAVSAVAVVSALGATVQVARIGDSGAKSAWQDTNMNSSARP